MTTTPPKFTKIDRGWYATADGRWAAIADGYEPRQHIGEQLETTGYEGFIGGEWALAYDAAGGLREDHNAGDNLDWFATKREAIEAWPQWAAQYDG